jgi:hypothetical protein
MEGMQDIKPNGDIKLILVARIRPLHWQVPQKTGASPFAHWKSSSGSWQNGVLSGSTSCRYQGVLLSRSITRPCIAPR